MTIKFNQKRALKAVKTEQAIEKQRAIANDTWELIRTAKGADDSASQSLFELVAHCMANTDDNSKECKKAIQRFFAFSEYKNASDLKKQTGIDLTRKISHLIYASSLDRKVTSYSSARAEYDRKPKAGKSDAGKANSATGRANASAENSEPVTDAKGSEIVAPEMPSALLEKFNQLSQMGLNSTEIQMAVIGLGEIMAQVQQVRKDKLKIQKFDAKGKEKKVA